jgi:hemerythrin-like domain-containing protein
MRATRILSADQELVTRFLAALGRGLVVAGRSKGARPGFFIYGASFIRDYMEPVYFQKEEVLLKALENCGFPPDEGPVGAMRQEYQKSREASAMLAEAAKAWQGGDDGGRAEVVWATSEYTSLMRSHFERLRNLIHPLLDQWVTPDDELRIAEELNLIEFADREAEPMDKYTKIVQMLEDEVSDWER